MTDTTKGMTAREAMRWYLDQPEGTEFEVYMDSGDEKFYTCGPLSVEAFARGIAEGYVYRIAAPKPQAPERVWVGMDNNGEPRYVQRNESPDGGQVEYIRRDIAESTLPRGRAPDFKVLPCGEQVWDRSTGLIWTRATIAQQVNHDDALQAVLKCDVGGHKWQLPTRADLLTLVDDTRHKPAIDTEAFPDTKNDWYWSSTPTAWSASAAWIVDFYGGDANDYDGGSYHACVRAVRVATAEELRVLILENGNE